MLKPILRRKAAAERKTKPITVWVTPEQEALLAAAAGDLPVSTWARAELLGRARVLTGAKK